ncbi:MAG TPA: glycoside hydrolase domain-containing protein [Micromonosporaceae bacterium]|nr:glycoside hydrolase domain-containing protein [Micromonosporaceae bacterium]
MALVQAKYPRYLAKVIKRRRVAVGLLALGLVIGSGVGSVPVASAQPPADALQVWVPTGDFASSAFVRVAQAAPNPVPEQSDRQLSLAAVRNGHASAQLAVTSQQDLKELRVQVDPLIAPGQGIGAIPGAIQVRYPAYIPDDRGGVVADPLREVESVDVPTGQAQPVWFTLAVPPDANPGTYQSRITISAHQVKSVTYQLTVNIADVTLPSPAERNFHLNLWFQPDTVADQLGLELWSDEHFTAIRPYLRDLASRGQRVINSAVAEDPWPVLWPNGEWRSQTYLPYHSAVDWYHDGQNWSFDFTSWDRLIEEGLDAGLGPYIHAFGLLMFRGYQHIVYTDTRTGERVDREVTLGGEDWADAWSAFLVAFEDHVRERGWLDRTYLAFDERPASEMQFAMDLVKKVAPVFVNQIAIAGSASTDQFAHDLSLNYSNVNTWSQEMIERRRAEGKLTTYYTWANPVYPNTVIPSDPIGARMLSWISAQHNLDGYLRWAYNSWPQDPYTTPTYRYRQGDEYLVYPGENGPVSSIRWELFREGQEDYVLLDLLATRGGADHPVRVAALTDVEPAATPGPAVYESLLNARTAIVAALEDLPPAN